MAAKILGGSLGEWVHVAGVLNFLRMAEEQGYRVEFTGPATPIEAFLNAVREVDPDIIAVSYRLTPENAALLLTDFKRACEEEGILGKRFVFGGTPSVVEEARKVGLFEALFSGEEPIGDKSLLAISTQPSRSIQKNQGWFRNWLTLFCLQTIQNTVYPWNLNYPKNHDIISSEGCVILLANTPTRNGFVGRC